ncbi:tetratricopeptide repeat protein [Deinococcus sp. YIM 77859]|uniref:tetratricopeptide repeat protein n=1 Tax=Deinococcus sp. YIM 77859 TaxID=1540221 RepID=UPI0005540E15|nr:tetratricopeptide repeat protein [Deinococcus sp. YIM 77859]
MTDPSPPPVSPPEASPDWRAFARAGEWRRALAAARLTAAPTEVTAALDGVVGVQEAIRARRPARAQRVLEGVRATLAATQEGGLKGEAALLESLIEPETLRQALETLEGLGRGTGGETEPQVLRARLAPALAHPLTRPEALNALGVLHVLREEPQAAQPIFEEALAADPGHYRVLTNLGNLELEAGRLRQAEARYREALRLNPEYDGAHHNLGVALRRQGRLSESVGAIRRAQRLSVKQARETSREDLRQQFGAAPWLPVLRWGLVALGILVLFLLLRIGGS